MSVELIPGNCLEAMAGIPDHSIDLVIGDLPYGTTRNKWDSCIPLDQLSAQLSRVCKPTAPIILFGQQPFTTVLAASNLKQLRASLVWVKTSPTGHLNAAKWPLRQHEDVLVFVAQTKGMTYNRQMSTGHKPYICKRGKPASSNWGSQNKETITISNGSRYPTTVLHYPKDTPRQHPTQKPTALLEHIIRQWSDPGATILDPTCGSGSTLVAAINTGRNAIGIEASAEYAVVAQQRIDAAMLKAA